MTGMSGRCRRHHQGTCDGPATNGLCPAHRAAWEAAQTDWKIRADRDEPCTTPAPPPFVVWLSNATNYREVVKVEAGWYFNHELCRTTLGPHPSDADAWRSGDGHRCTPTAPRRQPRSDKKHRVTHCVQGHAYTPANTIIKGDGHRRCRVCQNAQSRAARARKTTKKAA